MQARAEQKHTDPALLTTRTIALDSGEPEAKREEIRRYFHATFDIDEALLEVLRYKETFYLQADPLRHPLIFYFGHTATFYVNKLILAKRIHTRINPAFESIFAVGVDEMSWDDLNTENYDWPDVDAVQAYRDKVRSLVDRVIDELPVTVPITWDSPAWVILMGIEHARIHLETSSVLIRQLPLEHLRPHPLWNICQETGAPPAVNDRVEVPGGRVSLGKTRNHPLYGWDNEFGQHEVDVPGFKASRYLASNAEFLAFVEDGGYEESRWWTEEGLGWRDYEEAQAPRFWIPDGNGSYRLRHMLCETEMPWNWPAEVNYLEAKAFCNWKAERENCQLRLPTEEEWYLLRDTHVTSDQPYWEKAPGNINLEHYTSACPVDTFAQGPFFDLIGNVWQWTETPIAGFRGFEPHPLYDDFSTPTFDGKHNLIKGGAWISTGNEATRDARYAFRRHFYQHAGVRVVESEQEVQLRQNIYESDEMLCQYCEFHYGERYLGVPNYPKALAERCLELAAETPRRRALDLGCSVGRATFELARSFEKVTGLDFSAAFIRVGVAMQERGSIHYARQDEGELQSFVDVHLEDLGVADTADRVEFYQADACNLKPIHTGYDLILAANLIDRLYSPGRFLADIHTRINPGGLLVLTSPYTWLTEYTDRPEWIGAFRKDGEPYTTLDALHDRLSAHFEPVGEPEDVPFVIRETRRKFQHSLAQLTVWRRRA